MKIHCTAVMFLVAIVWFGTALAGEEPFTQVPERFTQAANRTFQAFDSEHEKTWQGSFFFIPGWRRL
ncbi:MAG: hypothetical protein RIK87_07480 [Fuerstiella sp.]